MLKMLDPRTKPPPDPENRKEAIMGVYLWGFFMDGTSNETIRERMTEEIFKDRKLGEITDEWLANMRRRKNEQGWERGSIGGLSWLNSLGRGRGARVAVLI